jgi:hypothetical protein
LVGLLLDARKEDRLEGENAFVGLTRPFPDLELDQTEFVWQGPFKLCHPATLPVRLDKSWQSPYR